MTTFTQKEAQVLKSLVSQLYAEPGFSDVDAGDIAKDTGLGLKAVGGVLTALQKKGVLTVEELSPRTGHLGLGENGEGVTLIYLDEYKYHERWAEEEGIDYEPIETEQPKAPVHSTAGFAAYLRRVGEDYAEAGSECTADDYLRAADLIEGQAAEIEALHRHAFNLKGTLRYIEELAGNAGRGGSK